MLFKRNEFKPDRTESSFLKKLYLTPLQRKRILKWSLVCLVLVVLSLIQDVILSQISIHGATFALVPCGILLCAMLLDPETSAVFSLISSTLYYFSGTAPGVYVIVLLTLLGTFLCIFRWSYLQRRFSTIFLCAAVSMMAYQLLVFGLGWFFGSTLPARFGIFMLCGGLSVAVMPLLYPIFNAISNIGGSTWKE